MTYTINTVAGPREVSAEFLAEAISAAVNGGIDYWCSVERYVVPKGADYTSAMVVLQEKDDDLRERGDGVFLVTVSTIQMGLERILLQPDPGDPPLHNSFTNWLMIYRWCRDGVNDNDATLIDADVADAIVQYGLFGKQIYG